MSRPFVFLTVCIVMLLNRYGQPQTVLAESPIQDSQSPSVTNGSFADWENGQPVGWKTEIGATNDGETPVSKIRKGAGPSIELSGDIKTRAWNVVSQNIAVQPMQSLRLSYAAKAVDVKRDGNQFDNCYVGVFFDTPAGVTSTPRIWPVLQQKLTNESRIFRVPDKVNRINVKIFLSKTGTLNVSDVKIESLNAADSFDILVADMARNYSFFEHKQIDWKSLTDRYREQATTAASTTDFAIVVNQMLGELKDMHISMKRKGRRFIPYKTGFAANYDFRAVGLELTEQQAIGKFGIVAVTKSGFGYVLINTLNGISEREMSEMVQQIAEMFETPGIILDLRRNRGGAEDVAAAIAGMFTRTQLVYGRQAFRSGPEPDEFMETSPRVLWPTKGEKFDGPIVCLIGPGTASSGEGFAMMMKANPDCKLVGMPTRGASGNPAPAELPNGVDVWYSRWKSLLPDGTPIEDVGIKPDIEVKHVFDDTDATFQKAIEILSGGFNSDQTP